MLDGDLGPSESRPETVADTGPYRGLSNRAQAVEIGMLEVVSGNAS